MNPLIVSTYPPRKCGIATFTSDLFEGMKSVSVKPLILAMIRDKEEGEYTEEVILKVREEELDDYINAAEAINNSSIDIVNIQHEFGIFGGEYGSYILEFAKRLEKPIVTTLHTVLSKPDSNQVEIIRNLTKISKKTVVMTKAAIDILYSSYGVRKERITVINHGVPKLSIYKRPYLKRIYGYKGKRIICTFGLISEGKGLEYAISGFAKVAPMYPDTIYIIMGETHPVVKKHYGEVYREKLSNLIHSLSLDDRVFLINRFLDQEELMNYLEMTDIFITPYIGYEQISSGALTFAVGAGKAIISTPYIYAVDLLSNNNGVLCKFRDDASIAEALDYILSSYDRQREFERRTRAIGETMQWDNIAKQYLNLFDEIFENDKQNKI
ncbi:MAG: glycosyltransferase family 4 protein [Caldisericia bacterium]|jgi:glycosyltransferase involved in cell wall biosynthesis|nr:glycosyltransferase family 4 protein [Caldisericia bacterium]